MVTSNRTVSQGMALPEEISHLIDLIETRRGFNLSAYKPSSLGRSIARRAAMRQCSSVAEYLCMVEADESELDGLLSHVMVGYSTFFRDPGMFRVLRERVLPDIIERCGSPEPRQIRVWTVACSTGEEAYSLAILFFEVVDRQPGRFEPKLFATDVDKTALAKARAGRYMRDALGETDACTVARYFTGSNPFTVNPSIRRMVRFGEHNVFADPPISHLDLITCRNMLIYLEREAQTRALQNIRYALLPGGYLILGKSEKLRPEVEPAFDQVDKTWQIYRKIEGLS
ncbi:MAG: protein-glutamate O-methyltransferase CheR [Verrucomicrobia bacterium]|nr:protein-glutamate O-methyltransferase CheR [Verrucomicrobiota bacterium]